MQKNTGQIAKEREILNYLRKRGRIDFNSDEVVRTREGIQICTVYSEQDYGGLEKIVKQVNGRLIFKDGSAWIKIDHARALPLLLQGLLWATAGCAIIFLTINNYNAGPPVLDFSI